MTCKIPADIIVVMHFVWILFMLVGFIFTVGGFWWNCPLTIWEDTLRAKYNPTLTYPGSFIVYYIERLVYPNVNPLIILIPTIFIAVFTILVFVIRLPTKIRERFKGQF